MLCQRFIRKLFNVHNLDSTNLATFQRNTGDKLKKYQKIMFVEKRVCAILARITE